VGFEPTVPFRIQQFSRLPDSTALAPHHNIFFSYAEREGELPEGLRESLPPPINNFRMPKGISKLFAEREGFEPSIGLLYPIEV
jgi:hypothetical protein